jgi:FdhD protein
MIPIQRYSKGALHPEEAEVVQEHPVPLIVNGRELATLVASPHELNFLVAGFLRLQGFVSSPDDFELLSVCKDFGAANVRIKGTLPEKLKPVLTSGCGTGVTFSTPRAMAIDSGTEYTPEELFSLMDGLGRTSEKYRAHGGIHSAAVGDGQRMILYAEDLGRHNTLDRIAGEALLKGIELSGLMLVTSGRISTEMAAKSAQLGIPFIASRTSPTDMAVKLCEESGITLIGYLRSASFLVYTHPERLRLPDPKIEGVTGVILAGGRSSRMGRDKALLPYNGRPLIETVYKTLSGLFREVVVVTNRPEEYSFLPCLKIPDIHVGQGSMAGVHAGLKWSRDERIFVAACDMPHLDKDLIRWLAGISTTAPALVPESGSGFEPLHAFYSKAALPAIEEAITSDRKKIIDLLEHIGAQIVPAAEVACHSPGFSSFVNLNTPEDYTDLLR